MAGLGALALAALELAAFVGVNAIGRENLRTSNLVEISTSCESGGLGGLLTRLLDGVRGELFGAQGH